MFYPLTRINENSNSHSLLFLSGSEQGTNNLGPVERWLLSTVAYIQLCCVVLCMWTLLLRCECHYVQLCGESIRCHDVVEYLLGSSSPSLLTLSGSSFPLHTYSPHSVSSLQTRASMCWVPCPTWSTWTSPTTSSLLSSTSSPPRTCWYVLKPHTCGNAASQQSHS